MFQDETIQQCVLNSLSICSGLEIGSIPSQWIFWIIIGALTILLIAMFYLITKFNLLDKKQAGVDERIQRSVDIQDKALSASDRRLNMLEKEKLELKDKVEKLEANLKETEAQTNIIENVVTAPPVEKGFEDHKIQDRINGLVLISHYQRKAFGLERYLFTLNKDVDTIKNLYVFVHNIGWSLSLDLDRKYKDIERYGLVRIDNHRKRLLDYTNSLNDAASVISAKNDDWELPSENILNDLQTEIVKQGHAIKNVGDSLSHMSRANFKTEQNENLSKVGKTT